MESDLQRKAQLSAPQVAISCSALLSCLLEPCRKITLQCRSYYKKNYSGDDTYYYLILPGIYGFIIGIFL